MGISQTVASVDRSRKKKIRRTRPQRRSTLENIFGRFCIVESIERCVRLSDKYTAPCDGQCNDISSREETQTEEIHAESLRPSEMLNPKSRGESQRDNVFFYVCALISAEKNHAHSSPPRKQNMRLYPACRRRNLRDYTRAVVATV